MNAVEIDKLLREQQDKFIGQLVSAISTYWNALLTGNGLLLAALSILVAITGHPLVLWQTRLIVLALFLNLLAILGLLLGCFKSVRDHYLDLVLMGTMSPQTDEEMSRIMAQAKTQTLHRNKLWKTFENFAVGTIIASTVLLIVIVWST